MISKNQHPSFLKFIKQCGLNYEEKTPHHVRLHQMFGEMNYYLKPGSTYYIFVQHGLCFIDSRFPVLPNMYASVKGEANLSSDTSAHVIIMERVDEESFFNLGGPIEEKGRLKYIDGCTDSLLIPPIRYGQSCLNHLHFPVRINQTPHTHPSIRMGIVAKGSGECITPFGNFPLETGDVFAILSSPLDPTDQLFSAGLDGKLYLNGTHSFRTFDETMDVIAFHPDSDFGPRDEEHPMINRTIVEGHSAKDIEQIRTK
jgi:hypothetical protein